MTEGDAGGRPVPQGPVQRRLLRLLEEGFPGLGFSTSIATRSTLGSCTVILRPVAGEADLEEIAAWLGEQKSVERVSPKKAHLHVRVGTDALRAWFCEGWEEALAAPGPQLPPVIVTVPREGSPCSLDLSRKAVVARSVAALLERQGHVVEMATSADEHVWLCAGSASNGTDASRIDVAEVDVRRDKLRARHGGIVTREDLRADIREDAFAREGRERSDQFADALISYLMTQAPRERRLDIGDQKVGQKLAELDEILIARVVAREKIEAEGGGAPEVSAEGDTIARDLIEQVEAAPDIIARAARSLDPAPVNRLLRSLGTQMRAAADLPAGDPLWRPSVEALETAMRLVAPDADQPSPEAAEGIRTLDLLHGKQTL